MAIEVRSVRNDEEFNEWSDALEIGFNNPGGRGDGARRRKHHTDLGRVWAAFDADRVVGTLVSLPLELTLPGLRQVPLEGISGVTVAATHRRQGALNRMMGAALSQAKQRGVTVAGLVAAEYPIYGRYGYGPATEAARWTLDAREALWRREPPGTVELIDRETALAEAPALWDRIRAVQPGAVSREHRRWADETGFDLREGAQPTADELHAVCRDESGRIVGYVRYKFTESWMNQRPDNTATAATLIAANPYYQARLWKFLADHDWVKTVIGPEFDPVDPLWRDLLVDRRLVSPREEWDFLWLRVLDPVGVLTARTYAKADRLTLRVEDKDGYAQGTFVLESAANGTAFCEPTIEAPDLTLPADVLGSVCLGGFSPARYAALGRLAEHTPGSTARLAAMLSTPLAPHNPMIF